MVAFGDALVTAEEFGTAVCSGFGEFPYTRCEKHQGHGSTPTPSAVAPAPGPYVESGVAPEVRSGLQREVERQVGAPKRGALKVHPSRKRRG